ncbi:MAG TPA: PKD domain-containing protein [Bacteroidia bacterium]|nr:PKD domain-containing protein [Bacteroidia bacterium]
MVIRYLKAVSLFLLVSLSAYSQNYNITNSTVNTCGGNFYDSGGNGGAYGNNENVVMTFCSNSAGNCIRLTFSQFNIESGYDFLTVYNGPNTASPVLGVYTGTAIPPVLTATTGCLTVQFTSDLVITAAGWAATLSCVPCPASACPTCNGGAPPPNDACSGAQNLGALPVPAACPNGVGAWANFSTTNICATAENPYTTLTGCQPAGNMASPATDVWYRFTITGPTLNINIAGLQSPNIGLYAGTNCSNLIGRGCAVGGGGVLNTSFGGLAPGTYYLQVSGGNLNDQCDFTLSLQNNYDCAGCVIQSNFTANPPPVNGTYAAGQTVDFCFSITDYNQTSVNWLHGVVPSFGAGWDLTTLTTTPPTSCSGQGTWSWYNTTVTSTATGLVTGPGFYFESPLGNVLGVTDGNPGNNYGDNNPSNLCDWTFCWTITTLPPGACVQGASLNISVDTYGDGESGSWTSLACVGDPILDFFATLVCCTPPQIAVVNPVCPGVNNGLATGTGQGNAPWDYVWKDASGTTIQTANNINGSNTLSNLAPGNYTLTVTDNANCISSVNFTITAPAPIAANLTLTHVSCNGAANGSISVNANGGVAPLSYSINGGGQQASTQFNGLAAGNYAVTVTDANGCTFVVNGVINQPPPLVIGVVVVNALCDGASNGSVTANANGGTGALTYSLNGGPQQASGTFGILPAGNYTVVVTDTKGCTASAVGVVNQPPPLQIAAVSANTLCNNTPTGTITANANGGTGALVYAVNGGANQASPVFNGLNIGLYNVVVTDANGCQASVNVNINQPPVLQAAIAGTDILCNGGADGTITANANGGTAVYSYSLNGGAGQPSGSFANITAGNYTVIVTDANGCTVSVSTTLNEPALLQQVIASTDALCFGSSNGSATSNANGGTTPYSYSLNGGAGQPSGVFNGLTAGNYTIVVTDANGCSITANVAVNEPTMLQSAIAATDALCNGSSDGTITANANGGVAPYTYALNGGAGQPTGTFTGLTAGNYTVVVTDANGCTFSSGTSVAEPALLQTAAITSDALCNGNGDGSVTVNANGGTAPYSFSLNGGASQPSGTFNNLTAGNYTVIVTDANGCTATSISVISEPVLLQSVISATDALCNSSADGTVTANANGGTTPYSYSLNGGAGQPTGAFNSLPAGNYTIVITDANGCTTSVSDVINEPAVLQIAAVSSDALCSGSSNGSVTTNANGGTAPYTFAMNGGAGQPSGAFTGLPAGNYTVVVTDANGCTASVNSSVNEPALLQAVSAATDALCNGSSDGTVTSNANGGTLPYSYTLNGGTSQPTGLFSGLTAGNYTVVVTDANGCTVSSSTVINEPAVLQMALAASDALCNGSADGTLNTNVSGGTTPYSYSVNGGAAQAANNFNSLPAGNYAITVTDANGCSLTVNSVINEPALLQAGIGATDALCSGSGDGSVTVNANGGTTPYGYVLNGGTSQVSGVFSGLTAGNYAVVVTDANGCTVAVNTTINEPALLVAGISATDALCNGSNDGSVTANSNGGTTPYSYSLNGGSSQPAGIFNNLTAGNYSVVITDANMCTASVSIAVTEPPVLQSAIAATDALCNSSADGSVSANANGGTPPYTYSLNGGAGQPAGMFAALTAGNYSVTVSDINGCTAVSSVAVGEPTAIQANTNTTPASCGGNDGTVTVIANGGTLPYQYSIDNGATWQATTNFAGLTSGNYTVLVEDANGCTFSAPAAVNNTAAPVITGSPTVNLTCWNAANGSITINSNGGTSPLQFSIDNGVTLQPGNFFGNLSAGLYNLVVIDVLGCQATANVSITQPAQLTVNTQTTNTTCSYSNGSLTLNANGGTGAYQYSANGGTTFQNGALFNGLAAGNYPVVVTDANNCTATSNAVITDAPGPNLNNITVTNVTCNSAGNGQLTVTANGGSAPLQYSIDNGVTNQATALFTGLTPGNYTVLVTDVNGCTASSPASITEPAAIQYSTSTTPATCGNSDGTLTFNASGGTGSLTYSINNGTTFQAGAVFNNLLANTYNLVVQDANGCQLTATATVNNAAAPSISTAAGVNSTCNGSQNGTITINATGGTGTLQYSINNGSTFQSSSVFTNLGPGNYAIIVEDNNGCQATSNVVLTDPVAVTFSVASTNSVCGYGNGTALISASGGTGTLTYSINNGTTYQSDSLFSSLAAGNYQIVVIDANNCTATAALNITDAPGPALQTATVTNLTCNGSDDGALAFITSGGTAPLQFSIDNGTTYSSASVFSGLTPGIYQVVIMDANGCTVTASPNITEPAPISASAVSTPATCGSNDGTVTVNASGGSGSLTYSINNGTTFQATTLFNALTTGNYNILIEDANGCQLSISTTVNNSAAPVIQSFAVTDVTCNGSANGTITINGTGGTAPLNFSINNGFSFQSGNTFSNLGPGTYNLLVTDANGCNAAAQVQVLEPAALQANTLTTPATCGNANGTISVNASGGTGTLNYSANGGTAVTGSLFSNLAPGPYAITVTDGNGCVKNINANVANAPGPAVSLVLSTNILCFGMDNGSIVVLANGGTAPLQYSINGGINFYTTHVFDSIGPGNYSIIVSDANGCTVTGNSIITQPTQVNFTVNVADATCGNNNGTITFNASGGSGNYTYSIDNGLTYQASNVFSGLYAANYDAVVRDGTDCTSYNMVPVNNTSSPAINSMPVNNISCFGAGNGSIQVNATGGAAPLSYSVNGGFSWQSSGAFNNLSPGSYQIIVTDANGCSVTSAAQLTQPAAIVANVTTTTATCGNSDGTLSAVANGGSGALSYSVNSGPAQPSGQFTNLAAGNYNIVITDATGCSLSAVGSVSNTNSPVISAVSSASPNCNGSANGFISITAGGGTGLLNYSINNGTSYQPAGMFNGLSGGSYSIVVLDSTNCITTANVTLIEPALLSINLLATNATCGTNNGTLAILSSGGTGALSFSIDNGVTYQAVTNYPALAPATYQVVVMDNNGCSASASSAIVNIPGPVVSTLTAHQITCHGAANGAITINMTGGTAPLMYSLNGGTTNQNANVFSSLAPGTFQIVITDDNGCTADTSMLITEPPPILFNVSATQSVCSDANGSINITASGGNGGFSYSVDSGYTYQSNAVFTGLYSGIYPIVIHDSVGCTKFTSAFVNDAPGPIIDTVQTTNISCFGYGNGTLSVLSNGGTGPFNYSIDNGASFQPTGQFANLVPGNYPVVITDANGCSASAAALLTQPALLSSLSAATSTLCNGLSDGTASLLVSGGTSPYQYNWTGLSQNSATQSGLPAGSYTVIITDNNGCTTSDSVTVNEPLPVSLSATITDVNCYGEHNGSINVSGTGGTGVMSYNWSGLNFSGSLMVNAAAGTYQVTATDANGCSAQQSYIVSEPALLAVALTTTNVACFGGSTGIALTTPSGGTSPYYYNWSNGASSGNLSGVTAGSYVLTLTDDHDCETSTTAVISEPALLTANAAATPLTCFNSGNGSAAIAVAGGTTPYSYLWSNGASTSVITGLSSATYTTTVTDANGCTVLSNVAVTQPAQLVLNVTGNATICIGQQTLLNASATGGNSNYTFNWSNGVTSASQSVSPAVSTTYTVTVTDIYGCTAPASFLTITVHPPLSLTLSDPDTICFGDQTVLSALAGGGNGGPYTYNWTNVSTSAAQATVTPQATTLFGVTVADGCGTPAVSAAVEIVVNPLPVVVFEPLPASGCAPLPVQFSNSSTTQSGVAVYNWQFGDQTLSGDFEPFHLYELPGYYTVALEVTSAEGCRNQLTLPNAVHVYPVPDAAFNATPAKASILDPVITFSDQSIGATWWKWDFGDGENGFDPYMRHQYSDTGAYAIALYVVNDYGCRDTAYGEVVIEGETTVYIPNAFTPNNDGKNDTFTVSGIGITDIEMSIFNRWGNVIYRGHNLLAAWDGKDLYTGADCQDDVYIYTVRVRNLSGTFSDFSGRVTLIR